MICWAFNPAPLEGGEVTCSGCGSTLRVPPRTLEPLGPPLPPGGESAEATRERIEKLHRQAESYNRSNPFATARPPEGLEDLADLDQTEDSTLDTALLHSAGLGAL